MESDPVAKAYETADALLRIICSLNLNATHFTDTFWPSELEAKLTRLRLGFDQLQLLVTSDLADRASRSQRYSQPLVGGEPFKSYLEGVLSLGRSFITMAHFHEAYNADRLARGKAGGSPSFAESKDAAIFRETIVKRELDQRELENVVKLLGYERDELEQGQTPSAKHGDTIDSLKMSKPSSRSEIPERTSTIRRRKPREKTNDLLIQLLNKNPEAKGWTIRQFAAEIKRSIGAIGATPMWIKLQEFRKETKAEEGMQRHRRQLTKD